jgi:DNA-binding CsgD family transcriptional regulator
MTERPFEAVGLSADADRAYPLLVATRGLSGAELARQMGVSAERARAACDELAVHELVRLGPDERWYPLPPHAGLLPLLARAQEQLRAGHEMVDRLGVQYQRVHEARCAEEIVQTVKGADAIRRRMAQVCEAARDELLIFARGDGFPEVPAGVRRRVVVERTGFEPGEWGAQVRMVDRLPVRMCVVDRSAALLPVAADGTGSDSVMLVIAASGLLDALVLLFESVWADAVPLGAAVPDHDALHGRILAMLVMGSTDAAMARSLGVAVRTVQRRITAMQRAAGVGNRIQLVWYAARHGWLD